MQGTQSPEARPPEPPEQRGLSSGLWPFEVFTQLRWPCRLRDPRAAHAFCDLCGRVAATPVHWGSKTFQDATWNDTPAGHVWGRRTSLPQRLSSISCDFLACVSLAGASQTWYSAWGYSVWASPGILFRFWFRWFGLGPRICIFLTNALEQLMLNSEITGTFGGFPTLGLFLWEWLSPAFAGNSSHRLTWFWAKPTSSMAVTYQKPWEVET